MIERNNANIGFEKQIWNAACAFWGQVSAAARNLDIDSVIDEAMGAIGVKRYE